MGISGLNTKNGLLRFSKYVAATTIIVTAGVTGGSFMFAHFAQAEDSEKRSLENQAVVEQLRTIQIEQAAQAEAKRQAKEAEAEIVRKLCLAHKLTDPIECARVGYEVR